MITESKPMCKARVASRGSWTRHDCRKPAVTAAGYCRTHDPELREQRAARRGPSKFERQGMGFKDLRAALQDLTALGHEALADRIDAAVKRILNG